MALSPNNPIVKRCLDGMATEAKGIPEEAGRIFMQAFNEASDDFEKFLSAYFVAKHQTNVSNKLNWFEKALHFVLSVNKEMVYGVFPTLYSNIADCYTALNETDKAKKNNELAESFKKVISDKGPFYHGTKADLKPGDMLTAGNKSNYKEGLIMHHIYFTGMLSGAGLAAALAKGKGIERVYMIEPTGPFENDPNVTDKKFPGNLTRSYRTKAALKIVGEVEDWQKQTDEDLQKWRENLAKNKGEIIN